MEKCKYSILAQIQCTRKGRVGGKVGKNFWKGFSGLKELEMFSVSTGESSKVFQLAVRKYIIRISL